MRPLAWQLYLLNGSLLIAHEIDSAYWQEWTLFGLPGGVQGFVVLNWILVLVVLWGLRAVVAGHRSGIAFSWILVGGGMFAVVVHSALLFQGNAAFRVPVSLALLGAVGITSIAQAAVLIRRPSIPPDELRRT